MGDGKITFLLREQIEGKILDTYAQFAEKLDRLNNLATGNESLKARIIRTMYRDYSAVIDIGNTGGDIREKIRVNLEGELKAVNNEELKKIYSDCKQLAFRYELPIMRELNVDTAYIMNIPKFLNYSMFTYNEQAGALDLSIPLMVNNPYFNIEKQLRAYSEELRQTNNSGILPRENPQRTEGLNILKLIHGYGESELEIGSGLRSGEPVLRIPLTERYLLPEGGKEYLDKEYLYFDIIHFQALFGYNRLFEAFAHTEVLSDLDSLRTTFKNKDAKKISIWLWKGDYNMVFNEGWHIGAEIGAYRGIFSDNSIIESASFRLSNREGELLHRYCANQFWINGFVKGQNYTAANLTMAASITFYDLYNAEKYEEALKMKIDQDINFYYSSNGGEHGNEGKRPPEDVELSGIQRNGKTVKVTFR